MLATVDLLSVYKQHDSPDTGNNTDRVIKTAAAWGVHTGSSLTEKKGWIMNWVGPCYIEVSSWLTLLQTFSVCSHFHGNRGPDVWKSFLPGLLEIFGRLRNSWTTCPAVELQIRQDWLVFLQSLGFVAVRAGMTPYLHHSLCEGLGENCLTSLRLQRSGLATQITLTNTKVHQESYHLSSCCHGLGFLISTRLQPLHCGKPPGTGEGNGGYAPLPSGS